MNDDDLKAWDQMVPVGREWGAPDAETLWALGVVADRLQRTPMDLLELDGEWCLSWQGRELARWHVSDTDWRTLRNAVISTGDTGALAVWDAAAPCVDGDG